MPDDVILVHLYARPDVIRERINNTPHPHQIILNSDIESLLDQFDYQVKQSWIHQKISIDTSDLTGEELLNVFLKCSIPYLNPVDALIRVQTA